MGSPLNIGAGVWPPVLSGWSRPGPSRKPASRRVAEKAGFVYEGMRRSHVAATSSDYEDPLYVLSAPATRA